MAILPKSGRAAIAKALKDVPAFLAWGTGDGAWGSTGIPAENPDATSLLAEIGRRKATSVDYAVPDTNGTIEIAGAGKFSVSTTPTRYLVYTFRFDFADAPTATLREIGLFINCTTDPALPVGQMYFTPAQVLQAGDLLQLENIAPIIRSAGSRETFQLLITL